jgi:hypothetical protein
MPNDCWLQCLGSASNPTINYDRDRHLLCNYIDDMACLSTLLFYSFLQKKLVGIYSLVCY